MRKGLCNKGGLFLVNTNEQNIPILDQFLSQFPPPVPTPCSVIEIFYDLLEIFPASSSPSINIGIVSVGQIFPKLLSFQNASSVNNAEYTLAISGLGALLGFPISPPFFHPPLSAPFEMAYTIPSLSPGDYTDSIQLFTNDCKTPIITIQVSFTIL